MTRRVVLKEVDVDKLLQRKAEEIACRSVRDTLDSLLDILAEFQMCRNYNGKDDATHCAERYSNMLDAGVCLPCRSREHLHKARNNLDNLVHEGTSC